MQTKFLLCILLTFIILLGEIEAKGGRGGGGRGGRGGRGRRGGGGFGGGGDFDWRVFLIVIGVFSGIGTIIGLFCCYKKKICCWYE